MRLLFTILACSFIVNITGCVRYVYIPVAVCPKPPVIKEQGLLSDSLHKDSTTDEMLGAFVRDVVYLEGLKEQYKTLLEGYNEPKLSIEELGNK